MKNPCINTAAGPILVMTLWDLIPQVRKHLLPEAAQKLAMMRKREYEMSRSKYSPVPLDGAFTETFHILNQSPLSLLTEFKKTTTKIVRTSKKIHFRELLDEVSIKSMNEFGNPTHLVPIGRSLYALVDISDLILFTTKELTQSLVCTNPTRNFVIYAPNMKVDNVFA